MKKLHLLVFVFSISLNAWSLSDSNYTMTVLLRGGGCISFNLSSQPKTTFTETEIVIASNEQNISLPLSEVVRYTFSDKDNLGISSLPTKGVSVFQDAEDIRIIGVQSGELVSLYSVGGTLLTFKKSNTKGEVSIPLNGFPQGIYIVKTSNMKYKFIRK